MLNLDDAVVLWITLGFISLVILSLVVIYGFIKTRNKLKCLKEKSNSLNSHIRLLNQELESKNNQISSIALQLMSVEKLLEGLKNNTKVATYDRQDLTSGIIDVYREISLVKSSFDPEKLCVSVIDPNIINQIESQYPEVTNQDMKLLSLMKMKMSNKEISVATNVTIGAVSQAKRRLKKKFNLLPEDSLDEFIRTLSHSLMNA